MRPVMPTLARPVIASLAIGAMTCISSTALAGRRSAESLSSGQRNAASEHAEKRIITITGTGEVSRPADSMRTSIGVESRATTLKAARHEAASKAQAVLAALRGLAIPGLEIRTADISLSPITESSVGREVAAEPRIIGYSASNQLSVVLKGASPQVLQAAGSQILEAALAAGANDVRGIDFFLSNPTEARRMALAAAVEDAQANAAAVARAANVRVVELRSISGDRQELYVAQKIGFAGLVGGGFPVEPGNIRVTAELTVRVAFAP
jgi:uncharacterized protein